MHQRATVAAMRTEMTNCMFCEKTITTIESANTHRHCTEGDVEVSLLRAGATVEDHSESSSSSSSSSAAGEAVDCHSHAGVE